MQHTTCKLVWYFERKFFPPPPKATLFLGSGPGNEFKLLLTRYKRSAEGGGIMADSQLVSVHKCRLLFGSKFTNTDSQLVASSQMQVLF